MFDCKWYLEGPHAEAINSLSIRGSLMVSGSDDGNTVIHDLLETFIDSKIILILPLPLEELIEYMVHEWLILFV